MLNSNLFKICIALFLASSPALSLSYAITILLVNLRIYSACFSVNAVPRLATTFFILFLCNARTSKYPSTSMHELYSFIFFPPSKTPKSSKLFLNIFDSLEFRYLATLGLDEISLPPKPIISPFTFRMGHNIYFLNVIQYQVLVNLLLRHHFHTLYIYYPIYLVHNQAYIP